MHPHTYIKAQLTELTPTTQGGISCETGKSPNPYHNFAIVEISAKKPNKKTLLKSIKSPPEYLPLLSPYTGVYGMRVVPGRLKINITPRRPLKKYKNQAQIKISARRYSVLTPLLCRNRRLKMTGRGGTRGAARDLTANPDFAMGEASSPPQGTKRSGGNRATSAEKKTKSAPKEGPPPIKQFWLGFEMMEKLAIEEGAPEHTTPTTLYNLLKSGFSEKEAIEFLKSAMSYPHVAQSCFPLSRPDGVP
jgi:hypothetical protein